MYVCLLQSGKDFTPGLVARVSLVFHIVPPARVNAVLAFRFLHVEEVFQQGVLLYLRPVVEIVEQGGPVVFRLEVLPCHVNVEFHFVAHLRLSLVNAQVADELP